MFLLLEFSGYLWNPLFSYSKNTPVQKENLKILKLVLHKLHEKQCALSVASSSWKKKEEGGKKDFQG